VTVQEGWGAKPPDRQNQRLLVGQKTMDQKPRCWPSRDLRTPGPSIVLPQDLETMELPGPAGRGPGVDLCGFLQLRGPSPPAAPRRGRGGLGYLSYKKPHKNRSRDPSRPAPEAILFPILGETLLRDLVPGPGILLKDPGVL